MASSPAPPASHYIVRDLDVDIACRKACRAGDSLDINGLTFDFLVALIESAPGLASYDYLADRVWKGRATSPEAIAQRASMLRRALSTTNDAKPYFESVRGRGFRLVGEATPKIVEPPPIATRTAAKSIAVLPFANLSGDPQLDYFGDGLAEDIISELSHIPQLLVISRRSTFVYRDSLASTREIADRLDVEYLLQGGVRRSGDHFRITAQLVDTTSEATFWSRKYDCDIANVFQVQDYLTDQIVTALDVELVSGEQGRQRRSRYSSAEAGELLYKGLYENYKYERSAGFAAREYFEEFIRLEPDSTVGYTWLAAHWTFALIVGWEPPEVALKHMKANVDKALAIDSLDPLALVGDGYFRIVTGDLDGALKVMEKVVAAAPNNDEIWFVYGYTQTMLGMTSAAITSLKYAMRLCPILPGIRYGVLGTAYRNAGRFREAIATFEECLEEHPDFVYAHASLAVVHGMAGHRDAAEREVQAVLEVDPEYTIKQFITPNLYRDGTVMEKCAEALRYAGMPE